MSRRQSVKRSGVVMVLLLVSLIMLLTFVAMAIDLGLIAVARTQCQDAADAAAMSGCRTLNGQVGNNYANVTPNAQVAATANTVLSAPITNGQVAVNIGRYAYVAGNQRFEGQFPGPSAENWSLVKADVTANIANQLAFSKVFNFTGTNVAATATAVHRPRDISIVLDFSGSMRYSSLMGIGASGSRASASPRVSNNPDTVFPTFGHYSNTATAALQGTSFTSPWDEANITVTTSDGRPPMVNNFYSTGSTLAFTSASVGYATTPGGDNYLKTAKNTTGTWCTTPADLLTIGSVNNGTKDATFEASGYTAYGMSGTFSGYTQGPGYWGKTFFIWPPNPVNDWRKNYFYNSGTTTQCDDNSRLWNTASPYNWKNPGSGTAYSVNYTAILNFIKNVGTNPFPSQLRSGRIVYYTAIPSSISSSYPPSDLNERFWKDYIDYVLGISQTGSNSWITLNSSDEGDAGYGTDFTFGTRRITAKSALTGTPKPYMHYLDNPPRPRTHFWFGPLTMIDFLGNFTLEWNQSPLGARYTWWPGTCHESPMYGCKLGIRAGLTDISNNHPNDLVALAFFSHPQSSSSASGRFNRVRVGLSRNYQTMQDSLWYPPSTIGNSSTVTPYATDNIEVPRASGYTCYSMGLMQAYNQFSANSSLLTYNPGAPSGDAGGNGRKGAQKVVIFETDGQPNTTATASFQNAGANNSYYQIRYNSSSPGSSEFPSVSTYSDNSSTVTTQIYAICNQLCAMESANPPGYSTVSKRALIHCIGFGPVFAPGASTAAGAIDTLNQMQIIGNVTDGMPSYKIIHGTESQMAGELQQAFTQILQSGVQISLVH